MSPRMRQRIRLIAGVWLGWTIAGLFYIIQETVPRLYRGGAVPWKYVFVGWMTGMYVCAALTPALLWLGNRWPIERRVSNAALHLCLSVVFSILATVLEVPILLLLGVFPAPPPPPSLAAGVRIMLSFGIQGGVIRYWAIIALHAVYRSQKNAKTREREAFELKVQASELARQLAAAQLSSLKMQLQPHFLFNTLGAIMVLIQQQKTAQAEGTVEKLGDLLRLTLDDVEAQEVPLWRELEFLRLYLSIEQVRFEDRLRVRISPTAPSEVLVPHMVLQPIVENAVRHGLGQSEEVVTIEVVATRSNGSLNLIVSDDGPGLLSSRPGHSGIGLANTRNRLARLYGDSAHLLIEQAAGSRCAGYDHTTVPDGSGRGLTVQLSVLVVDDEPLAREGLKLLLGRQPQVEFVSEAHNGREAIALLREQRPDLVLLDVQMPRTDGFAVVHAVGAERMPPVIFVTAHDQYAIRAFEIAAIDYLLKPVTEERFALAFRRAIGRLGGASHEDATKQVLAMLDAIANPPRKLERFAVRSGESTIFVPVNEVDWIEAFQNYVRLHASPATYLLHVPMNTVEAVLDSSRFLRIHRSHIVNVRRIAQLWLITHGQYAVELKSGQRLQSGRTYSERIRRTLAIPF